MRVPHATRECPDVADEGLVLVAHFGEKFLKCDPLEHRVVQHRHGGNADRLRAKPSAENEEREGGLVAGEPRYRLK